MSRTVSSAETIGHDTEWYAAVYSRDLLSLVGIGLVAGVMLLESEFTLWHVGIVIGFGLIALVSLPLVGFGIGQVALLIAVSNPSFPALLLVQIGLLLVVFEPARITSGYETTLLGIAVLLGVGSALWFLFSEALLLLAVSIGVLTGLGIYVSHRYLQVTLGLVSDAKSIQPNSSTSDGDAHE